MQRKRVRKEARVSMREGQTLLTQAFETVTAAEPVPLQVGEREPWQSKTLQQLLRLQGMPPSMTAAATWNSAMKGMEDVA